MIYRYGEGGLNKFIGVVVNKHEQTFEVIVLGLNNCRGLKESVPFVIPVAVTHYIDDSVLLMQSVIIPVIDLVLQTTPRELNKCGVVNK